MQLNIEASHQHWLNKRGITDEVLRLFNIETVEHPTIGPTIRIPYTDTHAKYRRDPQDDRKPKYMYDSGGKVTLYGADVLGRNIQMDEESVYNFNVTKRTVIITEGELDTLVCWSLNLPAVSSTGGAMSFQPDWADTLSNYEVYLCFDNDPAGAEGMVKVLKYLPEARVILLPSLPGVKDISDYVAYGGDFRKLLPTAKQYLTASDVEVDLEARKAQWQSTLFHEAWLDAHRKNEQRANRPVPASDKSDEVLRAKDYPMDNLIEFNKNFACCPFHKDNSPSLKYYPKTNSAYCFGACGKAYDSIDAYMHVHGVGFKEAVKELNKMVGGPDCSNHKV